MIFVCCYLLGIRMSQSRAEVNWEQQEEKVASSGGYIQTEGVCDGETQMLTYLKHGQPGGLRG